MKTEIMKTDDWEYRQSQVATFDSPALYEYKNRRKKM
jgi:hypothetical protein